MDSSRGKYGQGERRPPVNRVARNVKQNKPSMKAQVSHPVQQGHSHGNKGKAPVEQAHENPTQPTKKKEAQSSKVQSQVWHAFRNVEYINWNKYKEAKHGDTVLENYVMDKETLMQDVPGMELMTYGESNLPPKPPDPKKQNDI